MTTEKPKEVCSERVLCGMHYRPCSKPVKAHEGGKAWCTIHSPSYRAKLQAETDRKWAIQEEGFKRVGEYERKRQRQADLYHELVTIIKEVLAEDPHKPLGGYTIEGLRLVLAKCEALDKEAPK